jgi:adenylylsulfate kinase-like enzyme
MHTNNEQISRNMLGPAADPQSNESKCFESQPASGGNAVVVGLYGIPGSGKTFLLSQLQQELEKEHFAFYDGSHMIASLVPGGLNAFQDMERPNQMHWRQLAISNIGNQCVKSG